VFDESVNRINKLSSHFRPPRRVLFHQNIRSSIYNIIANHYIVSETMNMPTTIAVDYGCGHQDTFHLSKATKTGLLPSWLFINQLPKRKEERLGDTVNLRNKLCNECSWQLDLQSMGARIGELEEKLELHVKRVKAISGRDRPVVPIISNEQSRIADSESTHLNDFEH